MHKRKITVTTGTRADYGILLPLLRRILHSKKLELCLIVTGSHLSKKHGMTINVIKKDGFKNFHTIKLNPKNDSTFEITLALGNGISKFSKFFKKINPDINVVLGDRDEMLASAIAAYHMNIPNAHIHGGDISGGIDEYTRHAITKISNIHFPATKKSKQRILQMGENPKYVNLTGSPSLDDLDFTISEKKSIEQKYKIKINSQTIILVQHPVTTEINQTKKQIQNTLKAISEIGNPTIAISPNSDASHRIIFQELKKYSKNYNFIKMYTSFPRSDYLGLLKYCGVLVGNSSSGIIEASYFDIPVINIGNRQKRRERNEDVIDVEYDSKEIKLSILKHLGKKSKKHKYRNVYGTGKASQKIVKILENISLNKELIKKQYVS